MPPFMDFLDDLKLADEAIAPDHQRGQGAQVRTAGVRQEVLFHNAHGKVYCLLESPDA